MPDVDRSHLPIRRPSFGGTTNRTLAGSQPDWDLIGHPDAARGCARTSCSCSSMMPASAIPSTFGGPIQTPNYTRMAEGGVRYNRFHVTAICSPTRAALLTGRNSHAVGFGSVGEFAGGYPGYSATLPRDAAPLPRILRDNGYSTAAFGKWHLTPDGQQGPAGPFDRWPTGWGFEYFYGFLGGGAGQWDTVIAENQKIIGVDPKYGDETDPYYLPDAMADKAIEWLHGVRGQDAKKPFFAYFSTGCSHAPHHVAESWAAKYKGQFDQGWDRLREETFARQKALGVVPADAELTPRNEAFPAWDEVPDKLKPFYARQMEVYAGFSENADHNVGRVIDAIEELGELDNTLVIWIWGDNGASMEGHRHRLLQRADDAERHPPDRRDAAPALRARTAAWTPGARRSWRHTTGRPGHGPATPPSSGASRSVRTSAGRATRWSSTGRVTRPRGASFDRSSPTSSTSRRPSSRSRASRRRRPSTASTSNPSTGSPSRTASRRRTRPSGTPSSTSSRSATDPCTRMAGGSPMRTARIPWVLTPQAIMPYAPGVWDPDADPTELYYLPDDFSQAHDLAADHPDKVAELRSLFWQEAERYQVLPLLATLSSFFGQLPPLPETTKLEFRSDVQNVLSGMVPRVYNHSYTISADLIVPDGGAEGVIVAEADHLGGFSLFVQDGKLTHTYSMMGVFIFRQQATEPLPAGEVNVRMEFAADAPKPATGGQVTLYVNDKAVGGGRMDHTVPMRFSGYAGMDIGRDNGGVVDRSYADKAPFPFTGTIRKVVFDVKPHLEHEEAELHEQAQHAAAAHALSA